jgi:DNA mismatch repair protein MutH
MTFPYNESDPCSIEQYARLLIGRSLREVLDSQAIETIIGDNKTKGERGKLLRDGEDNGYFVDNVRTKGGMGQLLERYYFMYEPNNLSEPDFPKAGLELKSTPVKYIKGEKFRAKERLVLNIIDYMAEHKKEWEDSSFWRKNRNLLLIFYLYKEDTFVLDLLFELVGIWNFPPEDLRIIKEDWEAIVKKIRDGKAHEIHEGETLYLGACTKGVGHGKDLRRQPFSDTLAKQRAFSLKQKYVNLVIDRWTGTIIDTEVQSIVKTTDEYIGDETFEDLVLRKFRPYIGKTIQQIHGSLGLDINPKAKNYYATVTLRILGVKAKKAEEFEKADIVIRTVRLKNNNVPKEDISFPYFKFKELIEEEWETSTLKELLDRKFFFVIYKYDPAGRLVLRKVTFWNMPYNDLEIEARGVWQRTIALIKDGKADQLPRKSGSRVCHVRPHGANSSDTDETPDGRYLVKKCFWLNAGYIKEQIANGIID